MNLSEWINLYTLVAFALGVLLASMVKSSLSSVRSKVQGA